MRPRATVALALLAAVPGIARADDGPRTIARYTAGRQAGAPLTCITPDMTAQPQVADGQAILYFRGPVTYVARFEGKGCPQLRGDRTFATSTLSGQLCRHDAVRVVESGGGSGLGFCTFDSFVPYRR